MGPSHGAELAVAGGAKDGFVSELVLSETRTRRRFHLRVSRLTWRRTVWAYLFLLPNLIFVLVFAFIPTIAALYLSFTKWTLLKPPVWIGLDNYRSLLHDDVFIRSIANTFYFLGVITPVRLVLGLAIALLLNQPIRLRSFFRTITFLPWISSGVVVASIWLWLYNPDFGILNFLLTKVGLHGLYWYTDPTQAMPSIIIAALWRSVGWVVIIYLAGLQNVPQELHEAAMIDGASSWRRFRDITLPLLRPTTLLVLITTMIGSFQMFDLIYVMTNGGPINATTVIALQIYDNAFTYLNMGYAASQAFVLFAVILLLSIVSLRWLRTDY